MIKTLLSFVFSGIIAISFSAHSKTKVTWSMESNADRDPIFLEKLQNAYNSAQNNYELEIQFEPNETRIESLRTSMLKAFMDFGRLILTIEIESSFSIFRYFILVFC